MSQDSTETEDQAPHQQEQPTSSERQKRSPSQTNPETRDNESSSATTTTKSSAPKNNDDSVHPPLSKKQKLSKDDPVFQARKALEMFQELEAEDAKENKGSITTLGSPKWQKMHHRLPIISQHEELLLWYRHRSGHVPHQCVRLTHNMTWFLPLESCFPFFHWKGTWMDPSVSVGSMALSKTVDNQQ